MSTHTVPLPSLDSFFANKISFQQRCDDVLNTSLTHHKTDKFNRDKQNIIHILRHEASYPQPMMMDMAQASCVFGQTLQRYGEQNITLANWNKHGYVPKTCAAYGAMNAAYTELKKALPYIQTVPELALLKARHIGRVLPNGETESRRTRGGFWHQRNEIEIAVDVLDESPEMFFSVMKHEIGHHLVKEYLNAHPEYVVESSPVFNEAAYWSTRNGSAMAATHLYMHDPEEALVRHMATAAIEIYSPASAATAEVRHAQMGYTYPQDPGYEDMKISRDFRGVLRKSGKIFDI